MKQKSLTEIYHLIKGLPQDTVIGEFAGRDSVAAILKAMEEDSINNILPIASFAPTEYGNFEILESNYNKMVERTKALYGNKKTIFPLIYYSNFDLWAVMNGRFVDSIIKKFNFYTPCVGCHAYFHLLRIPIALKLSKKIIAGERESHDGRIKINQSAEALNAYDRIAKDLKAELVMPIRHVADGDQIEKIIGWEWKEGKDHQRCAFSKNYVSIDGQVSYDKAALKEYIDKYLYPVCITLGELLVNKGEASLGEMIQSLKDRGDII